MKVFNVLQVDYKLLTTETTAHDATEWRDYLVDGEEITIRLRCDGMGAGDLLQALANAKRSGKKIMLNVVEIAEP